MNALETLRSAIPDAAKDLRLNLGSVLQPGTLSKEHVWGTAVACAIASRNPQRLVQVATNRTDFELFCLAVSAINGCESCIRSHERVVLEGGLTEDHVNDAVRIAATFHGAAVALEM